MNCKGCNGSGACDPCDGYGVYPDSSPGAGDGPDCDICDGSGCCPDCHGTGTQHDPETHNSGMQNIEHGSDVSVG